VNHEIQHNPDVHRPIGERRKAVGFDEFGTIEFFLKFTHHWIKALDVTDLENTIMLCRDVDQFLRFLDIGSDRLFHQNVHALAHEFPANFEMRNGRNSHTREITGFRKRFQRVNGFSSKFRSNFLRTVKISVIDCREFHAFK